MVAGLPLRIQAILLPTLLRNSSPRLWLVQAAGHAGALRSASHQNAVPIGCTIRGQWQWVAQCHPLVRTENVRDMKRGASVVRN